MSNNPIDDILGPAVAASAPDVNPIDSILGPPSVNPIDAILGGGPGPGRGSINPPLIGQPQPTYPPTSNLQPYQKPAGWKALLNGLPAGFNSMIDTMGQPIADFENWASGGAMTDRYAKQQKALSDSVTAADLSNIGSSPYAVGKFGGQAIAALPLSLGSRTAQTAGGALIGGASGYDQPSTSPGQTFQNTVTGAGIGGATSLAAGAGAQLLGKGLTGTSNWLISKVQQFGLNKVIPYLESLSKDPSYAATMKLEEIFGRLDFPPGSIQYDGESLREAASNMKQALLEDYTTPNPMVIEKAQANRLNPNGTPNPEGEQAYQDMTLRGIKQQSLSDRINNYSSLLSDVPPNWKQGFGNAAWGFGQGLATDAGIQIYNSINPDNPAPTWARLGIDTMAGGSHYSKAAKQLAQNAVLKTMFKPKMAEFVAESELPSQVGNILSSSKPIGNGIQMNSLKGTSLDPNTQLPYIDPYQQGVSMNDFDSIKFGPQSSTPSILPTIGSAITQNNVSSNSKLDTAIQGFRNRMSGYIGGTE